MNKHERKIIAILGATGHVAKSVIFLWLPAGRSQFHLFARSSERLRSFLENIGHSESANIRSFNEFPNEEYDVIINCVGIGDPAKVKDAGVSILRLTESFDNMVLDYLDSHPAAMYINFSSGAVYGTDLDNPVDESTCATIDVNNIAIQDFYRIAKVNSETKHRALGNRSIIDLRIFGYFSRFVDLNSQFLISEVISCTQQGKELVTSQYNIVRDYVHPRDLLGLIEQCISQSFLNDVFDVFSLKPITKFEILEYFKKEYGLEYRVKQEADAINATGLKNVYYSTNMRAEKVGYAPQFTSFETIIEESKAILSKSNRHSSQATESKGG